MAKKTGAYEAPSPASDKKKALDTAIAQIEKTFGKGVVQQMFPLEDDTALKVTVEKYFTPNGDYIHQKGIEPDYVVEMTENGDPQLEKALEILKNK